MNSQEIARKLKEIRRDMDALSEMSYSSDEDSFKRNRSPEPNFDHRTLHKYQKELSEEEDQINSTYRKYFKVPQKHPKYKVKWGEFWSLRSKALIKIGCDPSKYDFSSEWKQHFFKYLKECKAIDHSEIKKLVYEKYSRIYKKQLYDRNDNRSYGHSSRDSNYRRSYSRSPPRSRKSRSYSRRTRSRSPHNRGYSNGHSSGHRRTHSSYDNRSRYVKVERRSSSPKPKVSKTPTVISVCNDLLGLDRRLNLYRFYIQKILENAKDYEKKHKKEYLMSQSEYEYLYRTRAYLVKSMNARWINKSMETKIRLARFQLVIMIRRWEKFMQMNGKLEKAIAMRQQGERDHQRLRNANRNRATRRAEKFKKNHSYSSSDSTSDYRSMDHSRTSTPNTRSTDNSSATISIKEEKVEPEMEQLVQERAELIQQIKQEEEWSDGNDESQFLIDENVRDNESENDGDNNNMLVGDMADIKLSASDISNEELIELFKDFETSSEDELEFIQLVMEEIESTDKARFDYLKRAMEEIQNSYEKDVISFVRSLSPSEAANLIQNTEILQPQIKAEEEKLETTLEN